MVRIHTLLVGLGVMYLGACSSAAPTPSVPPQRDRMVPVPVDAKTGYLPTRTSLEPDEVRVLKADVLVREKTPVRPSSQLIVVQGEEYYVEQLRMLKRFGEVIGLEELRQRLAAQGLTARVGGLATRDSVKQACTLYRPFLLLTASVNTDKTMRRPVMSMELLDPCAGFVQLFAARTMTSLLGSGSDQKVRRPLFNSLIDWIDISERFARDAGLGEGGSDAL